MRLRRVVSLTALVSFVLELVTSVILYIAPQGRVAYWAGWRLLGLDKTQWSSLHVNLGLLFFLALGLHIYYNWSAAIGYLRNKARQLRLTPDGATALVLTLLVLLGSAATLPPFSWVMDLSDLFKDNAARTYGEPPYGHAELSSLKTFAARMNLDPGAALTALRSAGFAVENESATLERIAKAHGVTPQRLWDVLSAGLAQKGAGAPAATGDTGHTGDGDQTAAGTMPAAPPPGTGVLTLEEPCVKYGLKVEPIVAGLSEKGISARGHMTLKAMATEHGMAAPDLYAAIREIALAARP